MEQTFRHLVFVLVTTLWSLSSLVNSSESSVPRTEGKSFLFPILTPLTHSHTGIMGPARLAIGTNHEPDIIYYNVSCVRLCHSDEGEVMKNITRQLNYPAVNLEVINLHRSTSKLKSGFSLTVLIIEANFPIFVVVFKLILVEELVMKMDVSLLYPTTLNYDEFYVATYGIYSYVIVVSHEYPCTAIELILATTIYDPDVEIDECKDPRLTKHHKCKNKKGVSDVNSINGNCSSFFELREFESLFVVSPEKLNISFRDITGTYIKADFPVTVFAGSKEGILDTDMNFYTVPAVGASGTFSIIPPNYLVDQEQIIKMVTPEANNTINIQMDDNLTSILLENPSDWLEISTYSIEGIVIVSESRLMVYYIMTPEAFGSCMMSITPEQLWSQNYIWLDFSLFSFAERDLKHFVMIVARIEYTVELRLDEKTIPAAEWHQVKNILASGKYSFVARQLEWSDSQHEAYHPQPRVRFYLIVQAMALRDSICTSTARFFLSKNCTESVMVKGDLMDNDCDHLIDEEEEDGIDNDGDGKVDEDVSAPFKVDGSWGEWSQAVCVVECGSTSGWNQRRRACDNPAPQGGGERCEGKDLEFHNKCKATKVECTQYCPRKRWGFNCSLSCPHCLPDCDKHSGECDACVSGMTGIYCNITCPVNCAACSVLRKCRECVLGWDMAFNCTKRCKNNTYGSMCKNCSTKCRDLECNNRTGVCKHCESTSHYGDFCDLECSDNCSSKHCDRKSGHCGHCINGMWDFFCDKKCLQLCEDRSCSLKNGLCELKWYKLDINYGKIWFYGIRVAIVVVSILLAHRQYERCRDWYAACKDIDLSICKKKETQDVVDEEIKEDPEEKHAMELLKRKNEMKMQYLKLKQTRKVNK